MEKIFHLKENGTTVKTEIIAGLTNIHDNGLYHCPESQPADQL